MARRCGVAGVAAAVPRRGRRRAGRGHFAEEAAAAQVLGQPPGRCPVPARRASAVRVRWRLARWVDDQQRALGEQDAPWTATSACQSAGVPPKMSVRLTGMSRLPFGLPVQAGQLACWCQAARWSSVQCLLVFLAGVDGAPLLVALPLPAGVGQAGAAEYECREDRSEAELARFGLPASFQRDHHGGHQGAGQAGPLPGPSPRLLGGRHFRGRLRPDGLRGGLRLGEGDRELAAVAEDPAQPGAGGEQ
jgi:hypothetical protein